jgi:dihydroorotate dehydrogenase electron transfer subunit
MDGAGFTTFAPPGHPATHLLPGTEVDLLGPLGRGFRLAPAGHPLARLLLLAQADYVSLLAPLFEGAPSVVLVVEATTRAQLPPPSRFPPALELVMVTLDGSAGYLGPIASTRGLGEMWPGQQVADTPVGLERVETRLHELIAWAECVCVAHEVECYPALAQIVEDVRLHPFPDFAQALVRVPMPCGVGVCDVCRVTTPRGEFRACADGPVVDLLDFLPS